MGMSAQDEIYREDQAVKKLEELAKSDSTETAHEDADDIILEFCPTRVQNAYKKIRKWYA